MILCVTPCFYGRASLVGNELISGALTRSYRKPNMINKCTYAQDVSKNALAALSRWLHRLIAVQPFQVVGIFSKSLMIISVYRIGSI